MPFLPATVSASAKKCSQATTTDFRPRVSVIIPTRNAGLRLEQTLAAIAAQGLADPFEVLVIDSGSTDGTPERCQAAGARVLRIAARSFGHGRTRNDAIAAAHGELVALTVQDAVPADAHWLASLVAALDGAPRAAGAYSRHLPRAGAGFIARHVAEYWYRHQAGRVEQRIEDLTAFAALSLEEQKQRCTYNNVSSLLRRAVWERIPFRELDFAEDLAWGYDVLRAGHTLVYEPASQVCHSHERPLSYEFRRAYVDGKIVGELFGAPAETMSFRQAMRLSGLWRRVCARANAFADGDRAGAEFALFRDRLAELVRDRAWYARHFGLPALARILGPAAPYGRSDQADIYYALDLAETRAREADPSEGALRRPLKERLKDALNWLDDWELAAGHSQRYPGPDAPLVGADELHFVFDALWDQIGRDYARRAVLEELGGTAEGYAALEPQALPYYDAAFPALESRMLQFAGGLMVDALAAGELTPALFSAIWRYAGAVVIGQRLGEANRYGLAGRWGLALQACLARGI